MGVTGWIGQGPEEQAQAMPLTSMLLDRAGRRAGPWRQTWRGAAPPMPAPDVDARLHIIRRRDRLGGILHEYQKAA